MRILLVEDESLLANRLAATLIIRGYAVDIARDGERGDFSGLIEAQRLATVLRFALKEHYGPDSEKLPDLLP